MVIEPKPYYVWCTITLIVVQQLLNGRNAILNTGKQGLYHGATRMMYTHR